MCRMWVCLLIEERGCEEVLECCKQRAWWIWRYANECCIGEGVNWTVCRKSCDRAKGCKVWQLAFLNYIVSSALGTWPLYSIEQCNAMLLYSMFSIEESILFSISFCQQQRKWIKLQLNYIFPFKRNIRIFIALCLK